MECEKRFPLRERPTANSQQRTTGYADPPLYSAYGVTSLRLSLRDFKRRQSTTYKKTEGLHALSYDTLEDLMFCTSFHMCHRHEKDYPPCLNCAYYASVAQCSLYYLLPSHKLCTCAVSFYYGHLGSVS